MSRVAFPDNVVAIGVERSRRAHPSGQPPSSLPAPDLTAQLAASLVSRWAAGAPVNRVDAERVIQLLLEGKGN